MTADRIPALLPHGKGHQFVIYGDSCSGVPGALHEQTFAAVNGVIKRIRPEPEFIIFPGDEIIGLTPERGALLAQWRHWLDVEMGWLDRSKIPLFNSTGNHTTYNQMSEDVFRQVLQLPQNGPDDQKGLSYSVRRDDLLLVFVHTLWSGFGGEGHVETEWLKSVLAEHRDARHKIVIGHHPVFPVNGFSGTYQREIGHEYRQVFWDILVSANVLAYICSHILAFDVQVHRSVLQICTAGAGTAHRMPEGVEYLHCIQASLDAHHLRYQVLDTKGQIRESLVWPPEEKTATTWTALPHGVSIAPISGLLDVRTFLELRVYGKTAPQASPAEQSLFSAFSPGIIAPVWLGLRGVRQTLTLIIGGRPGRSPGYWFGPDIQANQEFDIHLAFCPAMGPGGMLYRHHNDTAWTSMASATSKGVEDLSWPEKWSVGHGQEGDEDRSFKGQDLKVLFQL